MNFGPSHSKFSRDVLSIEIAGPDQEHFSIIDVPGIFQNSEPGKTTADDIQLVNDMVHSYMENPRSILLAVIHANDDIANQGILEKAKKLDPEADRTFGVLTKPDLVDQGAEGAVIEIMEGKSQPLKHGWHMVRNLNQKELNETSESRQSRNALEQAFFDTKHPWNQLNKTTVGVSSLRTRLQEILDGHLRRHFPKVIPTGDFQISTNIWHRSKPK